MKMKKIHYWSKQSITRKKANHKIPILDTVVNRFKTQIILVEQKRFHYRKFSGKRIFIDRNDYANGNVVNIPKRKISRRKIKRS